MGFLGVLGILLALAFLVYITFFKNWPIIPASFVAAVIVAVFNAQPIWDAFTSGYAPSAGNYVRDFMVLMIVGAIFGELIASTGCAEAIALKIVDSLGVKHVGIAIYILTCILTLGGVNVMVVIFSVYPIACRMIEKANLPRQFFLAAFLCGSCQWTMTCFPGTPSTHNLIPTTYLGTDIYAGPTLGIIASVLFIIWAVVYLNRLEKWYRNKNIGYIPAANAPVYDKSQDLPNWKVAFLPLVLVLALSTTFNMLFHIDAKGSVVFACTIAGLVVIATNYKRFTKRPVSTFLSTGMSGGVMATMSTAAVLGTAGVIQAVPAFQWFINVCYNLPFSPIISLSAAVNLFCMVTGSSSGGLLIFMQTMADTFLEMGIDPEVIHRITVMSCGGLDGVPHNSGIIIFLMTTGLSFKQGYWQVFVNCILAPVSVIIISVILAMMGVV